MSSRLVHFEGMDLAGKTTIAQMMAARPSPWDVRSNALVSGNAIYHMADTLRRREAFDREVLGMLYAAAVLGDIRQFARPATDTIQESTILLRSLAIHRADGTARLVELLESLLPEHPKFDASFVFTASIECRLARLAGRQRVSAWSSVEDLLITTDPQLFARMEQELVELSVEWFDSIVIDTTNLTPEQALAEVEASLPS